ncbi:hypothetical protein KFU94_28705 [Chloroflexi bacterium TSY]|nr:hypothetical protein [Chloroflexi bacterium TSY]
MAKEATPWIIKSLVPEEVYTDRAEFLDYFYEIALKAATRRTMSTVLLGRRRMGKTEIFRRVVNRLFFEQDPSDPDAVVPVYYSFPYEAPDRLTFAIKYLENFMRYYVGFYSRQPELVLDNIAEKKLIAAVEAARASHPFPKSLDRLLYWYDAMTDGQMTIPEQDALEIPRRVSDVNDSTVVVFLDEFQNTRLPQYEFSIVGYMQEAVESNTCPHFVTGSAMSILAREIIGRGALFGRFRSKPIDPLSGYWGAELALKAARYHRAEVPEVMAPVIADRCGGNPFYINAVVQQSAETNKPLIDEEAINNVLAVDIASGFIWGELYEQVNGWIERLNDYGITKWILYLSALEEGERISLERIQQVLYERERQTVSLDKIRDVLVKLSRGDLLEYLELGGWFRKIDDPILLDFLKVWGRIEVEGQNPNDVQDDLVLQYQKLERRIREYQGYLGEVFMGQILLNSQDKSQLPLPGRLFNSQDDIPMGWPLSYVRHRVRLQLGQGQEIDLLAAIGTEKWVCQSKWVTTRKIGPAVLRELMAQAEAVQTEYESNSIRMWIFAHEGLTRDALELAQKEGILWSTREQLDELLTYLGLRKLPPLTPSAPSAQSPE